MDAKKTKCQTGERQASACRYRATPITAAVVTLMMAAAMPTLEIL